MKRIVLVGVLLALAATGAAKPPLWVKTYSTPDYANFKAVAVVTDPSCNVYVVGTADFTNLVVIKYSIGGALQWADVQPAATSGAGVAAVIDSTGAVYVLSTTSLIKYSPSGVRLWTRTEVGTMEPVEMAIGGGKVACVGKATSAIPESGIDIETMAFDLDGTPAWTASYSQNLMGSRDVPTGIAADKAGNVYVTGTTQTLEADVFNPADVVTIKYSRSGAQEWAKYYGQITDPPSPAVLLREVSTDIGVMSDGSVAVSGVVSLPPGYDDIFLVRYSSAGAVLFAKQYSGPGNCVVGCEDYAAELTTDIGMHCAIAGYSHTDPTSPYVDILTQQYDSAGAVLWQQTEAGPAGLADMATGIASFKYRSNRTYVTGVSYNEGADMDCLTTMYWSEYGSIGRRWTERWDGPDHMADWPNDIIVDDSGDAVVVGYTETPAGKKLLVLKYEGTCCHGTRGDVNGWWPIDISDLSLLVSYLTIFPKPPICFEEANVNGVGIVDLSDLSLLIAYLTANPKPTLPVCP